MTRLTIPSLVLLVLMGGCSRENTSSSFAGAPVIIISIDTLRADHLPMFGYKQVDTPALTALRADSVLFRNAFSHVPLTLPSHVSMLTGLLPPENGVRNNIGYPFDGKKHPTIATMLAGKGYATGAAVSAYVLRGSTGLGTQFQFYDDNIEVRSGEAVGQLQRPGSVTAASAESWIGAHRQQPLFFFLHLFEPHTPYTPPEPFRSRYASKYDGEIAAADAVVGQFLAYLHSQGLYDRSLIILMSDHGEGLMDHGEDEHGIFLYREDLHVPLMVKMPGSRFKGETVDATAQLTDILPTVAAVTGATPPAGLKGRSLLDLRGAPAARHVYSETLYPRIHLGWSELRSLTDGTMHYIEAPAPELFDMASDPGEHHNVLQDQRRSYAALKAALATYDDKVNLPTSIDPEEARKLSALGYLGSAAAPSSGPLPDPKDRIGELTAMRSAARLAAQGNNADAIGLFQSVLARNPGLTDGWVMLSESLEAAGDSPGAIKALQSAIRISPTLSASFALRIAGLDLTLGSFDEAVAHAGLALGSTPGPAHIMLARIALAQRDYAGVHRELAAVPDASLRGQSGVISAQADVAAGQLDRALATVNALHQEVASGSLAPTESLEMTRGDILARMDHKPEAETALSEEVRQFPHNREAWARLTLVYLIDGRAADAERTLDTMVARQPGPASIRFAGKTIDGFAGLLDPAARKEWKSRLTAGAEQ